MSHRARGVVPGAAPLRAWTRCDAGPARQHHRSDRGWRAGRFHALHPVAGPV